MSLNAIQYDFMKARKDRQKININLVYDCIKCNDIPRFHENINNKELNRTLNTLKLSFDYLWKKCTEDLDYAKIISLHLAKNATRQGTKDETIQLDICDKVAQPCGIKILKLSTTAWRATKDGKVITNDESKSTSKDKCLKSFDAMIDGKMKGFISAKVVYGSGGHQDNVFEELHTLAEWWKKYKHDSTDVLVLLVDTDLEKKVNELKLKYEMITNILVVNHFEFQEYVINVYYN